MLAYLSEIRVVQIDYKIPYHVDALKSLVKGNEGSVMIRDYRFKRNPSVSVELILREVIETIDFISKWHTYSHVNGMVFFNVMDRDPYP